MEGWVGWMSLCMSREMFFSRLLHLSDYFQVEFSSVSVLPCMYLCVCMCPYLCMK